LLVASILDKEHRSLLSGAGTQAYTTSIPRGFQYPQSETPLGFETIRRDPVEEPFSVISQEDALQEVAVVACVAKC
jgi:hypothetical protein